MLTAAFGVSRAGKSSSVAAAARYLVGIDQHGADARPAWASVAICRVAIFSALYIVFYSVWRGDQYFDAWHATKQGGVYHPFGILKLFGANVPPLEFWWAVRWVAQVSTICAIVGLITRPMMIASVVSTMLLALLLISDSYFWSHNWNVVFLAAIPFAFCNAGSAFSFDRLLARYWPSYPFSRRTEPVLWGVLAGQAAIALFVFAAFWAKIFATINVAGPLGPFYYIFSDNMRNILGMFWLGTPENLPPPWIEWAWSTPLAWQALVLGHLAMQAAPVLALFSLHRPMGRLVEGLIFLAGTVSLGLIARGWNWAWLPLAAFFIDWDYYLRRWVAVEHRPFAAPWKVVMAVAGLVVFFGVYTVGWAMQKANGWGLYPFSNMSFYAGLYVHAPYMERRAYADYMIGEVTLQIPDRVPPGSIMGSHWTNVTARSWIDFWGTPTLPYRANGGEISFPFHGNNIHGLGRETDLDRVHAGLKHVQTNLVLRDLPEGARLVAWLKTAGFPAYPEPMSKKTLHAGVRGIWEPATDRFTGLVAEMDRDAGQITIKDIRGETGAPQRRQVFARANAHRSSEVLPLVAVPGEWADDRTFTVSPSFLVERRGQLLNVIIRTETIFGRIDFDGPVQWL